MEKILTNNNSISKAKLPSFFSLIGESVRMYQLKWKALLKITSALMAAILVSIVAWAIISVLIPILLSTSENAIAAIVLWVISAVLLILILIFLSSWFGVAMIIVLRDSHDNIGVGEAMKRAKPFIFPYIIVVVLTSLATVAGLFFFIIPGIIFSVWFLFAQYIAITDNEKGTNALAKSKAYVKDYFWQVLCLGFLGWLLLYLIQLPISLIPVLSFLFSIAVASPLSLIYVYLMFNHLREIKKSETLEVSQSEKKIVSGLGIVGLLSIIFIVGTLVYFAPSLEKYFKDHPQEFEQFRKIKSLPANFNELVPEHKIN